MLRGENVTANPLALRTSQRETAEVNLQGATSGLERAELNLRRTRLRAPFNATVVTESLDVGQRVGPGAPVARLVGTDEFWVRVGIRVEALRDIEVPGVNAERGSEVKVVQRLADGTSLQRKGRVLRLVDQLDASTRRAQLLIGVLDPLSAHEGLPLLVGAYVEVAIDGHRVDGIVPLPQEAIHDGHAVWVVRDGRLERRGIRVRFAEAASVYVDGLGAGDSVVVTPLSTPVEGMTVTARPAVTQHPEAR